jgi:transcriptional regulator
MEGINRERRPRKRYVNRGNLDPDADPAMYLPSAFTMDDREALLAHAAAYPFATLITHGDGVEVSHLPLLVGVQADRVVLRGHLARENPQYAALGLSSANPAGVEALAIFHGPHGYVSPSVYTQHPSVPTWNYVVVHARGRARLVDESGLRGILEEMVARFETAGWRFDATSEYAREALGAIAGFEVTLERIEGKWKLSQNRPLEDQHRVVEWLGRGDDASRAVAAIMRSRLRG